MADRNFLLNLIISAKDNASSVVSSAFSFLDRTTSATANKIRDAFSGLFSAQGLSAASNFEEAMARVEAVMRPLPDEFQTLRDKAEEMGRNTRYTATQAAEGLEILAKAGFTAKDSIAAIDSVLSLAQGASISLAEAAGYVSDTLTQFGLQAEQSARVVDALSKAANSANMTVGDMGQSLKYVGGHANQAGLSLEKTAAILDVLAQGGIRADMAGTALRDLLQDLNNPASEARESLYKLGINTNSLAEAIDGLKKAGPGGAQAIADFGVRSSGAMRLLVNAGTDGIKVFEDGIVAAKGYAESSRKIMDDNLKGAVFAIQSSWEAFEIALKSPWLEPLQAGIRRLSVALNDLSASGKVEAAGKAIVSAFRGIGEVVSAMASNGTAVVAGLATALTVSALPAALSFGKGLAQVVEIVRAMGIASAASAVASRGLSAALALVSGPVGLMVAAMGAAVAVMASLWERSDKQIAANEALEKSTAAYTEAIKAQTLAQNQVALSKLNEALAEQRQKLDEAKTAYAAIASTERNWISVTTDHGGIIGKTTRIISDANEIAKIRQERLAELDGIQQRLNATEERAGIIKKELGVQEQALLPGIAERNAKLATYREAVEKATQAEEKAAAAVKNSIAGTQERVIAEDALIAAGQKSQAAHDALARAEGALDRARMDAQKGLTANTAALAGQAQANTLAGTAMEGMGEKIVAANLALKQATIESANATAAGMALKNSTEIKNKAYQEAKNVNDQLQSTLINLVETEKRRVAAAATETATLESQAVVTARFAATVVDLAKQQGTALDIENALQDQRRQAIKESTAIAESKEKEAAAQQKLADALNLKYKADLLNQALSTAELTKSKEIADQAQDLADKKRAVAESSALIAEKTKLEIVSIADVVTAGEKELAAKTAVIKSTLELAKARGDDIEAIKLSAQLADNATEQAKLHADTLKVEADATRKAVDELQKKYDFELKAGLLLDDTLRKQLDAAKSRAKIAADEAIAAQKDIELKQRQQQQAEKMAGPIGALIRLYEQSVIANTNEANAIERNYANKIRDLDTEIKIAEAKGDSVKASALKIEKAQAEADMEAALAEAKNRELDAEINLIEAKKLSIPIDEQITKAGKEKIAALDEEIAKLRAAQEANRDKAAAAQADADATKAAAEATKSAGDATEQANVQNKEASKGLTQISKSMWDLTDAAKAWYDQQIKLGAGTAFGYLGDMKRSFDSAAASEKDAASASKELQAAWTQMQATGDVNIGQLRSLIDRTEQASAVSAQYGYSVTKAGEEAIAELRSLEKQWNELADTIESRNADLRAQLAELQGDKSQADTIRNETDLTNNLKTAELELQLARTGGNTQAIAEAQQNLLLIRQIYEAKQEQIDQEARAARNKTASNNTTNNTTTNTTTKTVVGSGGASTSGGITLNINAGNAQLLDANFADALARQLKPKLDAIARRSA